MARRERREVVLPAYVLDWVGSRVELADGRLDTVADVDLHMASGVPEAPLLGEPGQPGLRRRRYTARVAVDDGPLWVGDLKELVRVES